MSMVYIKVILKKKKGEKTVFLPRIKLRVWLIAAACSGGTGRKGRNLQFHSVLSEEGLEGM